MNPKWWDESAFTADSVSDFVQIVDEYSAEAVEALQHLDLDTAYRYFGAIVRSLEHFEDSDAYKNVSRIGFVRRTAIRRAEDDDNQA